MGALVSARFFLHIRRLPSGRVIVTPVPFTDLACDEDSEAAARELALVAAGERLGQISGALRAHLSSAWEAELDSVQVSITPKRSSERIDLNVGLVVVTRPDGDRPWYVAYAPGVARWSVVARDREQLMAL